MNLDVLLTAVATAFVIRFIDILPFIWEMRKAWSLYRKYRKGGNSRKMSARKVRVRTQQLWYTRKG